MPLLCLGYDASSVRLAWQVVKPRSYLSARAR
jgi:hypothetical protein